MATTLSHSVGRVGSARSDLQFVTFSMGERVYAVNVADVVGIYRGLPMIPKSKPLGPIVGNVRIGDQRIPAFSLRRFAGLAERIAEPDAQWTLVVHWAQRCIALIVDQITEVVRLPEQNLGFMADTSDPFADYVAAMAVHHGRTVFIPDFQRLLQDALPKTSNDN
jgi:chemotaxis signal transduction protein